MPCETDTLAGLPSSRTGDMMSHPWDTFLNSHTDRLAGWTPRQLLKCYHSWLEEEGLLTEEEEETPTEAPTPTGEMHSAILVYWTESERGWGQRPDGVSLHKNKDSAEVYIADYWEAMPPRDAAGRPPDEYSFPGQSRVLVKVNDQIWSRLVELSGLRLWKSEFSKLHAQGAVKLPDSRRL